MNEDYQVTLTIPAEADYLDLVRLSLYGFAHRLGYSYEEIEDMKVAVSEACTNAVLHAYPGERDGRITISYEKRPNELEIRIKDRGAGFAEAVPQLSQVRLPERPASIHEWEPGGMGIYLMRALMDDVEIAQEEGTEIILKKRLPN
ncbi:serine-protein kinase RsbW [Paenibacillus sp. J31TS4]|uniref:anti-sigma B factor RsbW n=1 Tax=Paenibacillus sp. J31TS4 TaxID=2807195 RepID=UPI001AFEBACF|nr:anti-sigma B factor RsbW [Paenibacillus sp. J31TS4]GIP40034.1 serine-protein kinase RsbW [Paenibacillus sp. J31TS4]